MNQIYYRYRSGVFWSRRKIVSDVYHGMNTCALSLQQHRAVSSTGTFRTTVTSIRNSLTGPCDCTVDVIYMWPLLRIAIEPISHDPLSTHCHSLGWSITMIPLWSRKIIVRIPLGRSTLNCGASWLRSTAALSKLWHAVAGVYLCATRAPCSCGVTNNNNPVLYFQLGVCHYSRLWVECLPKASPFPLDDMGGWQFTHSVGIPCLVLSV